MKNFKLKNVVSEIKHAVLAPQQNEDDRRKELVNLTIYPI